MPSIFTKGLQTSFFEGFTAAATQWEQIAMRVPSNAAEENYAWLGTLPRIREFRGERIPKRLAQYGYTIRNKEFEASVEVPQKDLDDDQTGKYGPLVRSIGEQARLFPDELIFGTLLPNGFTELCYDGQYFFDTDHSEGSSGVQSNKMTSALTADNWRTARKMLRTFKDDNGRPINLALDLVTVVPPDLADTAEDLFNADNIVAGLDNRLKGASRVLVNPYATDTNDWFVVNVAGIVRPFIWQEREFEAFSALETDPNKVSESGFMRRNNYYGTYLRGNAGYGMWQKAVGSKVA